MRTIETTNDIAEATEALLAADPRLAQVLRIAGPPPLRRRPGGFAGLVAIVVSQQLSRASADAIMARLDQNLSPLDAAAVAAASDERLGRLGLSRPKIRTLRAIAEADREGAIDFAALHLADDAAVAAALTAIKGIGPWSAEIYLLSCLGRRDVFPAGDLALQEAARLALSLPSRPSAAGLAEMSEVWRPWRSVAAALLWSYYRVMKRQATGVDREQGAAA
jgi:DNA-3-methyladenine glycosylase II